MKVFVNYFKWIQKLGIRNTDLLMPRNFSYLEESNPGTTVIFNRGFLSNFLCLVGLISRKIPFQRIARVFRPLADNVYIFPWQIVGVDVIYSHGYSVRCVGCDRKPTVMDSGFMSDDYVGVTEECERAEEVRSIERQLKAAELLVFSSRDAISRISNLSSLVGKYARLAPTYLMSGVIALEEDVIRRKFSAIERLRIAFVGRQGARKGIDTLFFALEGIRKRRPDVFASFEISVVTRDMHWEERFLSLGPNVSFRLEAQYHEVRELMCNSHVFCLPTRREALGLVFLEAMAYGCVVIADNRQPRVEIFDEGRCGLLVCPEDAFAVEAALIKVYQDPATALKLALAARSRFLEEYDRDITASRYVSYFEEAIGLAERPL